MAKFSKTIQHDYLRFKATFPDGRVLSGNYSRNGHTVGLDPFNAITAREISNRFTNIDRIVRRDGGFNLGQMFEVLEPVAKSAMSIEEFLPDFAAAIQAKFGVDINNVAELQTRDATTVAVVNKGRGLKLDVRFANGEDFSLTINGKSINYIMTPDHSILSGKLASMTFGLMNVSPPAELAALFKDAAENANDIEGWIENIQSGFRPGANNAAPAPAMR